MNCLLLAARPAYCSRIFATRSAKLIAAEQCVDLIEQMLRLVAETALFCARHRPRCAAGLGFRLEGCRLFARHPRNASAPYVGGCCPSRPLNGNITCQLKASASVQKIRSARPAVRVGGIGPLRGCSGGALPGAARSSAVIRPRPRNALGPPHPKSLSLLVQTLAAHT